MHQISYKFLKNDKIAGRKVEAFRKFRAFRFKAGCTKHAKLSKPSKPKKSQLIKIRQFFQLQNIGHTQFIKQTGFMGTGSRHLDME